MGISRNQQRTKAKDLVMLLWNELKGHSIILKEIQNSQIGVSKCTQGTGSLHKLDGNPRKIHYEEILLKYQKTSTWKLKLGCKWAFQMDDDS